MVSHGHQLKSELPSASSPFFAGPDVRFDTPAVPAGTRRGTKWLRLATGTGNCPGCRMDQRLNAQQKNSERL